jgi:hypothetical protein
MRFSRDLCNCREDRPSPRMKEFSSSAYLLLHGARDHRGMRYVLAALVVLALVAIGAAGARSWHAAPSSAQPRLSAIELRPAAPPARARKSKIAKPARKPAARRTKRRTFRTVRASRPRATTPVWRGASPSPVPAPVRGDDDGDDGDDGDGGDDD